MAGNIDPKLTSALRRGKGSVQAVVTLRPKEPGIPLAPAETEKSVQSIVERASRVTSSTPKDVTVFRNLQSFSIDAKPALIESILDESDVDSASLNAS